MIANTLEPTLTDIIARLRQGRFPSVCHPEPVEGSLALLVEQGIVLRVLQELGWETGQSAHED